LLEISERMIFSENGIDWHGRSGGAERSQTLTVWSHELETSVDESGNSESEVTPDECPVSDSPSVKQIGPAVDPAARRSALIHARERMGDGNEKEETHERDSVE
jgi:hypothetical protein